MKTYNKTVLLEKWGKLYKLLDEYEKDKEKFSLICKALEQVEDDLNSIGVTEKDYLTQRGVDIFTDKS